MRICHLSVRALPSNVPSHPRLQAYMTSPASSFRNPDCLSLTGNSSGLAPAHPLSIFFLPISSSSHCPQARICPCGARQWEEEEESALPFIISGMRCPNVSLMPAHRNG
ncbi:hypothetical protein AAFF_G00151030 [Aldrovandia affinis]|uniref:Uncharacterized protein n=1 Tax=Aldrovandia affinis TaxID=143900 RepID=A0AAD7W8C6_9TELE|nr:hypothetical protein AAFF_G00151030 [Aldrovandia affinis]